MVRNMDTKKLSKRLNEVYGTAKGDYHLNRYLEIISGLEKLAGTTEGLRLYSAPGRTEICGNHTDHQHGKVLAGAVTLDIAAAVIPGRDNLVQIKSRGHRIIKLDISDLKPRKREEGKAASLVRGVAAALAERGFKVGGFTAYTTSDVIPGSGLSSSAAFEIMLSTIFNEIYNNNKADAITLAQLEQLRDADRVGEVVLAVDAVFAECPALHVQEAFERLLDNGNAIETGQTAEQVQYAEGEFVRFYRADGSFAGVYAYRQEKQRYQPVKMFLER